MTRLKGATLLFAAYSSGCYSHWECDEDQVALLQVCDNYVVLEPVIQEAFAEPNPVSYGDDVTLYALVDAYNMEGYRDVFPVEEVFVDFPATDLETIAMEAVGNNQYVTSVNTALFSSQNVSFTVDAQNAANDPALLPVTSYFTITGLESDDTGNLDTGK